MKLTTTITKSKAQAASQLIKDKKALGLLFKGQNPRSFSLNKQTQDNDKSKDKQTGSFFQDQLLTSLRQRINYNNSKTQAAEEPSNLTQSDKDMKAYLDEKEDTRKKLQGSALLPLGLMFTEEMYKANFILDRWLKRGQNEEQSAASTNQGEQQAANSHSKKGEEQKAAAQGKDDESKKNDKDEDNDEEDDDDDDHNDYDNRNNDNDDDNDGGVMMPIPDVSF